MDAEKILGRLSYYAVYDNSILDAIKFASENGFSGVQVAIESPHLAFEELSEKDVLLIKEQSEKLGIRLCLHAPDGASLMYPYPEINKGILEYYSKLISFASATGAELITLHAGSPTLFPTDTDKIELFPKQDEKFYYDVFCKNLDKILSLAKDKVCICVENYDLNGLAMRAIETYLGKTDLGLCWDLRKTYSKKDGRINQEVLDFFIKNRSYVRQVHLHSLVNGQSHKVIQKGVVDFLYYFDLLKDVDVLDYCIEVRPKEKAVESLENLKKILGDQK